MPSCKEREARVPAYVSGNTACRCLLLLSSHHHEFILSHAVLCHGFVLKPAEMALLLLSLTIWGRKICISFWWRGVRSLYHALFFFLSSDSIKFVLHYKLNLFVFLHCCNAQACSPRWNVMFWTAKFSSAPRSSLYFYSLLFDSSAMIRLLHSHCLCL